MTYGQSNFAGASRFLSDIVINQIRKDPKSYSNKSGNKFKKVNKITYTFNFERGA